MPDPIEFRREYNIHYAITAHEDCFLVRFYPPTDELAVLFKLRFSNG